jgi:hypothetical protein
MRSYYLRSGNFDKVLKVLGGFADPSLATENGPKKFLAGELERLGPPPEERRRNA